MNSQQKLCHHKMMQQQDRECHRETLYHFFPDPSSCHTSQIPQRQMAIATVEVRSIRCGSTAHRHPSLELVHFVALESIAVLFPPCRTYFFNSDTRTPDSAASLVLESHQDALRVCLVEIAKLFQGSEARDRSGRQARARNGITVFWQRL